MPFMLRLHLYQLKRNFINQYKKKLYHQSLGINKCIKRDNTQEKSSSQELIQYWKFFKYQKIVVGVYDLIGNCVEDFLTIISLSQIKRNALFISGGYNIASIDNYLNDRLKFEVLIKKCEQFQKSQEQLIEELKMYFSKDNKLVNDKVCYLLSVYYFTVCKHLPNEISKFF